VIPHRRNRRAVGHTRSFVCGGLDEVRFGSSNVCYGSKADMAPWICDVCFTPENGH
jgi:hypothetical protein